MYEINNETIKRDREKYKNERLKDLSVVEKVNGESLERIASSVYVPGIGTGLEDGL